MRLSIFTANLLSSQLLIDLQKIYLGLLPEEILTEKAINECLSIPSTRLFMTMFNDRHIGAVKVIIDDQKAVLSELCIREVTRRRGIGKNLLKQIEKQLTLEAINEIEYNLQEVSENELEATKLFLTNCDYQVKDNIAYKKIG